MRENKFAGLVGSRCGRRRQFEVGESFPKIAGDQLDLRSLQLLLTWGGRAGGSEPVPGWRSPPTTSSHWRQPLKEKKEVLNLSRRSSGGGWRSDGFGQGVFGFGAFSEDKYCFHLETNRSIACFAQ